MYKLAILLTLTYCIYGCVGGNVKGQKILPALENTKWIEHPQPILIPDPSGSWNELTRDTGNTLLKKNGKWVIYHSGQNDKGLNPIGINVSHDSTLVNGWADYSVNSVLLPGATGVWDDGGVAHPTVLERPGEYLCTTRVSVRLVNA